jgi:hypothetical protein
LAVVAEQQLMSQEAQVVLVEEALIRVNQEARQLQVKVTQAEQAEIVMLALEAVAQGRLETTETAQVVTVAQEQLLL